MKFYKIISLFIFQIIIFCFGIYISNYISWHDFISTLENLVKKEPIAMTIYGPMNIEHPIISDAIKTPALLRMKNIDQGGPGAYFHYTPHFSRYDHCIGVFTLIQKFGGSIMEQITGLYHDVSHTAFSHVADLLFTAEGASTNHSYQDEIHIDFLKKSSIKDFCLKYNIDITTLNPDSGEYHMLENDAPDLCADRLEYNLHTGVIYKLITEKEVREIISHLHYDTITFYQNNILVSQKMWFFDDICAAKKFALLPLHFMRTLWNAPWSMVLYKVFKELLNYSFEKAYITKDDFLYNNDQYILDILYKINDNYIIYLLNLMHNINDLYYVIQNPQIEPYDDILKGKFRGIDPLILTKEASLAVRLTEIDYDFFCLYSLVKSNCQNGIYIKYKKPFKASEIVE